MNFLKQALISFCIMSTILLWGLVLGFTDNEMAFAAVTIIVIQWLQFIGDKK